MEADGIYLLSQFGDKVAEAAKEHSPAVIGQYIYDLAKEYNRFYAELSIFNEQDESAMRFRIAYSALVADVIKRGMGLLGINVPDRM